jgi:hypothetical protein
MAVSIHAGMTMIWLEQYTCWFLVELIYTQIPDTPKHETIEIKFITTTSWIMPDSLKQFSTTQ